MSVRPWNRVSSDSQLLQQLAESDVPMWIFDQETLRFLAVNEAALAQYGYTRAEFLARTVLDIRPLQEIPKFLHTAVMRRHSSVAPERWHHLTKSGRVIRVAIQSREVRFQGREAELVCAKVSEEESPLELNESPSDVAAEP